MYVKPFITLDRGELGINPNNRGYLSKAAHTRWLNAWSIIPYMEEVGGTRRAWDQAI